MKANRPSRHYISALVFAFAGLAGGLFSLPAVAQSQAQSGASTASPSPYVGKASAKELYREYGARERRLEPHSYADELNTPLAALRTERAASMMRRRTNGLATHDATSSNTVSSMVQTQDYTLPLEDVTSAGTAIDPSALSNTGAHIDPTWFPDESRITYSSDASSDGLYHLYSLPATGIDTADDTTLAAREAALSQMTTDTTAAPHNERWPSLVSSSQIAYCQSTASNVDGPYNLIVAPILTSGTTNLPYVDQTHATAVVSSGTNVGDIYSVERPVYVGNVIIYAATVVTASGLSPFHIFEYTLSTGTNTQLTSGSADEENPTLVSTPSGTSVIVFDSNASGYPANSTGAPLVANGVSGTSQRNLFAMTTSATGAVQVTDSATADSIEPSLGYVTANQATGIGEGVHLFFSSNRINGHYNIYDLAVTIPTSGTASLTGTELDGSTPNIVLTSDPAATDSSATPAPVGGFDNLEPAAPPFVNFNTILFASARYLVNNIDDNPVSNAVLRYNAPNGDGSLTADSIEQQPTDTVIPGTNDFSAVGSFPIDSTSLDPTGSFEILSSHDADIDPPTLLRFDSDNVVKITTTDDYTATAVRQPATSQTIHFFVRLSDRQTGVGAAYLQIKNPNSAYQDEAGNEHKVYTKLGGSLNDELGVGVVEPSSDTYLHPLDNEATRLYSLPAIGGYFAQYDPIQLGNLRLATPNGYVKPDTTKNLLTGYPDAKNATGNYYQGGPIASFAAVSTPNATSLTITGFGFLESIYSQRPIITYNPDGSIASDSAPSYNIGLNNYHVAGCTLDLYDGFGNYRETVQVVRVNYSATATTATYTITPLNNEYATPTTGSARQPKATTGPVLYGPPAASQPGYAVINQVGYFDYDGAEVDAQAIQAGAATTVDGTNPASYTVPPYIPGMDDNAPYTGEPAPADPTNGNALWVPLTPISATDNQGGVIYEGTWTTPTKYESDWYIDVIAYDNASASATTGQNWRIYDNVWGFSTRPFVAHTSPGGILLVNDYMLPQKYLSQGVTAGNAPDAYFGAESYLTDIDANPQDAGNAQQLAALPDSGFVNASAGDTTDFALDLLYHRPSEGGLVNAPYYANALGVNSYTDGQQNSVSTIAAPTFPIQSSTGADSVLAGTTYPTATPDPPSQSYDIWRILCRGALPASILNDYSPSIIRQPADQTNNQPAKFVLSSPSCVIWSSPLAGEEFVDNGTIADPSTETLLEAYVNGGTVNNLDFAGGGRLYVEGTSVGFATSANASFYKSLLGAVYTGETQDDTANTFTLTGFANHTDYISYDAYLNNDNGNDISTANQVGHGNFKLANGVNDIIPNWAYIPPSAAPLQLAYLDPAFGSIDSRSDASLIDGGGTIQGGNSGVIFIDTFTNSLLTAPPATGPLPVTAAEATELVGKASANRLSYTSFAPPSGVASGGAIVAYSSFGLESVSQNTVQLTGILQYSGGPADTPAYGVENQRSDLVHNLVCFLRTGTLQGLVYTVQNSSGGAAKVGLGNAIVSAYITADGGVDAPKQTYTAISGADGTFKILGLPAGKYGLSGYIPGYSFTQNNGTGVYIHGGDIGTDNIQAYETQPGSLTVTTVDPTTGTGVEGVTVTAAEVSGYGTTSDLTYTAVTDASGTATFSDVETGSYVITATPPTGSVYETTIYGATSTTTYTAVAVAASTQTSITLKLNIAGATISGKVTNTSGTAVSGATVTFANTSTTGSSPKAVTTAADGTYTVTDVQPGTYTPTATPPSTDTTDASDTLANITVIAGQAVTGENFVLTSIEFGTIEGEVDTANGTPASGVTVTLTNSAGKVVDTVTSTSATTDNVVFSDIVYGKYTVTAESALGNVSTTVTLSDATATSGAVTFTTLALPAAHTFTGVASDLSMISVPYDYSSSGDTLADLLGYSDPKITIWEPLSNQYATPDAYPADTFRLGFGYWIRFPAATEYLLLAGTPAGSTTISVPLYTGWNMIGEPFGLASGLPLSDVTITDSTGNTYPFSTATAIQYQIVGPTLYTYQPGDTAYEQITSSGTLAEYEGYWVHALTNCTLNYVEPSS